MTMPSGAQEARARKPAAKTRHSRESNAHAAHTAPTSPPAQLRTGPELILATRAYASEVAWKSWWYLLSTAALLAGSLAATLFVPFLPVRIATSVLTGFLMLRLFVIYHDQQHDAILSRSKLARFVCALYGMWSLSPSSIWRASHNHHHNHNSKLRGSHIGSFPIMTAEAFRKASRGARLRYLFQRHPLTLALGYGFVFLFGMCLNPFLTHPRRHWDCAVALVLHFSITAALLVWTDLTTLLLVQTVPSLLAFAIGSYLFYAQHNFPDVSFRPNAEWSYEAAALESSSFLRAGPVLSWFTANIGYHHIHHLNSKIPFYRLPEAMREIPELQSPRTTSLSPVEVYRCLSLKVWDTDTGRMTGLPQT
jgi:omega-6 fatty acid desaturase (delta-12 desaturase)